MPDRGSMTVLKGLRVRISARKSEAGLSYYPGIPAVFIEHYIDEQQARKERAKNYHGNQFSKAARNFQQTLSRIPCKRGQAGLILCSVLQDLRASVLFLARNMR